MGAGTDITPSYIEPFDISVGAGTDTTPSYVEPFDISVDAGTDITPSYVEPFDISMWVQALILHLVILSLLTSLWCRH